MSKRNIVLAVLASISLAVLTAVLRRRAESKTKREPDLLIADHGSETLTLRPLHAFNEMRVLDRAGRYGWHSVQYGPFFHVVSKDDRQWEHARTMFGRIPYGEGWEPIGSGWGWWSYYARPLDAAAVSNGRSVAELINA